jgi:hypothetical protein
MRLALDHVGMQDRTPTDFALDATRRMMERIRRIFERPAKTSTSARKGLGWLNGLR